MKDYAMLRDKSVPTSFMEKSQKEWVETQAKGEFPEWQNRFPVLYTVTKEEP